MKRKLTLCLTWALFGWVLCLMKQFTLFGFNQASDNAQEYANIAAVADQMTRVVGDVLYVPDGLTKLVWCAATGYDCVRAKLESPSLRRIGVMMIEPKNNESYVEFQYKPEMRYTGRSPITLSPGEGLEAFVYVGSNETLYQSVGVALSAGLLTPVEGEIWTCRATYATLTTAAATWVNGEITFEETLPVGRYQIVGANAWNQGACFFRFVPVGGGNRPGGLCGHGVGAVGPREQRLGRMGAWLEFHSSTPPSIEFFGNPDQAGGGSCEIDLIKIA